jgi:putative DNA primase/helicase
MEQLTRTKAGPAATEHNAVLILMNEPAWKGVFQYDEFACRIVVVKPLPLHEYAPKSYTPATIADGDEATSSELQRRVGREATDDDAQLAAVWIERTHGIKMNKLTLHDAISTVAKTRSIHPVREFLSSLKWDGVRRLGKPTRAPGTLDTADSGDLGSPSWLATYMGADDNDYTRNIGRWWIISAVARIFMPGCQAQHMMILEGSQGLGKSRALRALFHPWFSEDLPDTTSKDALQQLSGIWGMEVAEMDAINKGGVNAAKRFISKAVDRYRPPYARQPRDFPRQIVFCGTTNQVAYLFDTTGNRRYWPVLTRAIDVEGIKADRDQIFAEAMLALGAGENWWPEPQQVDMLRNEQDGRVEQDPWYGPVVLWMQNRKVIDKGITVATLLESLQIDKARWGPTEERRAVRLLTQLGRIRVRRLYDNVMQYVYDEPTPPADGPLPPTQSPTVPPPEPAAPEGYVPPIFNGAQTTIWDDDDDWKD